MVAWTQGFAPKPISIGHIWLGPPVLGYVSFGCFQIGFLPHLLGLVLFGLFYIKWYLRLQRPCFLLQQIKSLPFLGPSRIHLDTSVSTKTALRGPAIGADIPWHVLACQLIYLSMIRWQVVPNTFIPHSILCYKSSIGSCFSLGGFVSYLACITYIFFHYEV